MATSRARHRGRRSRARALAARRSAIREVFDAANRLPDAIRLEIGEPSFRTPRFVVDAAFEAAAAGRTGYTPNGGYASLREALAEKIERVDGFAVDPDAGRRHAGRDERALLDLPRAARAGRRGAAADARLPEHGRDGAAPRRRAGLLPARARSRAISPRASSSSRSSRRRTKAIFANTPGNPTGAVFPAETVRGLAELAAERGVWLISDEVYDELILDDLPHVSAAALVPDAPVVSVYSFSKVYAMTGWRLGYCAAPPQLADVLRKLQEPQVSCPSAISQHAAAAVLRGPRDEFDAMRDAYRERRDRAVEAAAAHGLRRVPDAGHLLHAGRRRGLRACRRGTSRFGCSTSSASRSRRARCSGPAERASCASRSRSSRTSWPRACRGSHERSRPSPHEEPVGGGDADAPLVEFLRSRRDELVEFARALVATPSPNPPGDERAVAALVVEKLRELGVDAYRDGRPRATSGRTCSRTRAAPPAAR